MDPIFRWNGAYFGFVLTGSLFDRKARYLAWISDGVVWNADGTYLGQLYERGYVLVKTTKPPLPPQTPRSSPLEPSLPSPWPDRPPRTPLLAFEDALEVFADSELNTGARVVRGRPTL